MRSPFLVDVLRQRPSMEKLALMGRKLRLAEEDRQPILRLVDRIYRDGEVIGGFGIESWMNAELSGRDGFLESYQVATKDPGRYRQMSQAAAEEMENYCSVAAVTRELDQFLQAPGRKTGGFKE